MKEDPSDAEIASHKLMYRAGLIRKLASGFYTFLPLAKRVLEKIEKIIREEMNRKGAMEVLMPMLQPRQLWEVTGRWQNMGPEMMRLVNRQDRDFVLGPTHEEVITDLVAHEVKSYRQLPVNFYQIQTKFRDEIRPRFGLMRAREFIMKDAYSFDADLEGAQKSYQDMYDAYVRIFKRCGCPVQAVEADTGMMGGVSSAEFMVPSDTGEEAIIFCPSCGYAANREMAVCAAVNGMEKSEQPLTEIKTPDVTSVEDVSRFLKVNADTLVKTLLYVVEDSRKVIALIRGDRCINEGKLQRLLELGSQELRLANPDEVFAVFHAPVGFVGPQGIESVDMHIYADNSLRGMKAGVTGANKKDFHVMGLSLDRDVNVKDYGDFSEVIEGDLCSKCQTELTLRRGIEVGHVFNLGTKYSHALKADFLDKDGRKQLAVMGCYGIGVSRTMAAIIEVNHDPDGIIWPISVAPFDVLIVVLDPQDKEIQSTLERMYSQLRENHLDVLVDDRDERAGVKFKDADLIGIPFIVTIGQKSLKEDVVELKDRRTQERRKIPCGFAVSSIIEAVKSAYDPLSVS